MYTHQKRTLCGVGSQATIALELKRVEGLGCRTIALGLELVLEVGNVLGHVAHHRLLGLHLIDFRRVLDVFGTAGIVERAQRLFDVGRVRRHRRDDARLCLAPERLLRHQRGEAGGGGREKERERDRRTRASEQTREMREINIPSGNGRTWAQGNATPLVQYA